MCPSVQDFRSLSSSYDLWHHLMSQTDRQTYRPTDRRILFRVYKYLSWLASQLS